MKWQIRSPHGEVTYYNPATYTIVMYGCTLRNNKQTAQKIFDGANKTVCAWVECESVETFERVAIKSMRDTKVSYNPKKKSYWDIDGTDSDKVEIEMIYSVGVELYALRDSTN